MQESTNAIIQPKIFQDSNKNLNILFVSELIRFAVSRDPLHVLTVVPEKKL